jgi:spore maturation protein CgeB
MKLFEKREAQNIKKEEILNQIKRILIITPPWIGGLFEHIAGAFEKRGDEVVKLSYRRQPSILRKVKIHNIIQVRQYLERKSWEKFNFEVLAACKEQKPELFLSFNESFLFSTTIEKIQKEGCRTVNFVSDNPFDSLRFSFFPISLKYYDTIFVFDEAWIPGVRMVAPRSKVTKLISGGGFNPHIFYPAEEKAITALERDQLTCDISFTGESYGMRGEGGYRSDILDYLGEHNVKIWGDEGWKQRFPYYRNLSRYYQGGRLSYDHLRKLYHLCTINLNLPSPQVLSGFQPRTFEIAACKGFQIADWREELDEWFDEDELVTFRNIPELLEKVDYFVRRPEERTAYVEKLYKKVVKSHSWEVRVEEIMKAIDS